MFLCNVNLFFSSKPDDDLDQGNSRSQNRSEVAPPNPVGQGIAVAILWLAIVIGVSIAPNDTTSKYNNRRDTRRYGETGRTQNICDVKLLRETKWG